MKNIHIKFIYRLFVVFFIMNVILPYTNDLSPIQTAKAETANKIKVTATNLTCYDDTTIMIMVKDYKKTDKITVDVENKKLISVSLQKEIGDVIPLKIVPKKSGTTNVTISTSSSKDKVLLKVTSIIMDDRDIEDKNSLSAKKIYAASKSSMVQINTNKGLGSGFFIAKGILVTNYHVIENVNQIEVVNYQNKKYSVTSILGYDKDLDIAILSINSSKNDYLTFNTHGVTVGEEVYSMGSPLGLTDTFSNGIVTNSKRIIDNVKYIQTNASISMGNSGGPLLNAYGEVIGIITATYLSGQNLNLALDINQIYEVPTNHPLKVTEFYNLNQTEEVITEDKNIIYEDELKSTRAITAQTIDLDAYVFGTMLLGGQFDIYKFNITRDGFYNVTLLDEFFEKEVTQLDITIHDENFDLVRSSESGYYGNKRYQKLYLTPGIYYIMISPILSYNKTNNVMYSYLLTNN